MVWGWFVYLLACLILQMEETKLNQHMERVIRGIEANEAYLVGMVLRVSAHIHLHLGGF